VEEVWFIILFSFFSYWKVYPNSA